MGCWKTFNKVVTSLWQTSCVFYRNFLQNSNSGKWTWSIAMHQWFSEHVYFYWALVVQASHSYPKVMHKGHTAHSKWFWAKRRNKCESLPLFTRNSGNFLLCFMSKRCPVQAFAFCRKMLDAICPIWCKFSIKVGGEIMQSSWCILPATGPYWLPWQSLILRSECA